MIALAYIAREGTDRAILSTEIASVENLPQRFLENILVELKSIDILGSKLGKNGGYFLKRNPSDIQLSEVIRHFEGAIALLYCVSEKQYQPCEFCKDEASCKIRKVFKKIRDNTFKILEKTSLSDLI